MTNAIETQNLTRRYGALTAVDSLNLEVPAGSLFGLIGPNGAGKTTTLRMLAGLLEPSAGTVLLHGENATDDVQETRKQIGYMPDFFGVYEDMLVWEYLDFFARCYKLPPARREQLTDELLELVDLADKRNDYVEALSRGMRQRLCLAHALVHDPKVLLLDEPASGLDPRARIEMRELLRELGAMGKTVIVSSHILTELAELCDSVGIIEQGKLVVSGPIDVLARQAKQGSLLNIKTLSPPEEVEAVLANHAGVSNIYREPQGLDIAFDVEFVGEAEETAALLAALIHAGIQVTHFSEESSNLEEVFLRLTQDVPSV